MMLTTEGEHLHRYCQQIAEMSGEVLANIQGAGIHAHLRLNIAGPTSIMRSRIIPRCQTIVNQFPNINCNFSLMMG